MGINVCRIYFCGLCVAKGVDFSEFIFTVYRAKTRKNKFLKNLFPQYFIPLR